MLELDRNNFETEVLKSENPVLVDFWGPQCAPCLALMPAIERMKQDYAGQLKVAKVDATRNRMLCARLRVLGLPTFLIYRKGEEVSRLSGGSLSGNDIEQAVKSAIGVL